MDFFAHCPRPAADAPAATLRVKFWPEPFEMGRSAASPAQQHTADAIHRRRDRPCGRPIHLNTGSARAGDGLVRRPDWQGELEQRPVFAVR